MRLGFALACLCVVAVVGALAWLAWLAPRGGAASSLGRAGANRAPPKVPQPIDFPHWRHAGSVADGGMEINCLYCHTYARRSAVAGIPPLAKCMGCHSHIATDRPEIVKLTEYWRRGEPVPWKKVHDLPDFVYFSHERHVQRFVFQQMQPVQQVCGYCHGDVKTMGVAEKQKKLTMGWCLSCHKQFQGEISWRLRFKPPETPVPAQDWVVAPADQPLVARNDTAPVNGLPIAGMPHAGNAAALSKAPLDCWQCHK